MTAIRATNWRVIPFALATLLVFGVPNVMIYRSERLVVEGAPLLLELNMSERRNLLQGQYLRLYFPLLEKLPVADSLLPRKGMLAVKLDSNNVGTDVRLIDEDDELFPEERILRYHRCADRLCTGADAYYVEQGVISDVGQAHYAEFRVSPSGRALLIGLLDSSRHLLTPSL